MICPTCKTHIPDGSVRCPACHAPVAMTIAMPAVQGRWCPSCGGGLSWEDEVCPHCNMPLESLWEKQPETVEAPVSPGPVESNDSGDAASGQDETHEIPRIESAIPAEDDPTSKVKILDEMPRTGRLLLAAVFSAALVGGLAIAITHPWDPDQYSIKATTEADTSMAGFPGTVESLTGQDNNSFADQETPTGDDATLALLVEAHKKLGKYADRADESQELFLQDGCSSEKDVRQKGKRAIDALAIDVSNLIAQIQEVDVTSGTYVQERDNLVTLGNWLRNRVEILQEAWKASAESTDPAAEEDRIVGIVIGGGDSGGADGYKTLFDESYKSWKPKRAA